MVAKIRSVLSASLALLVVFGFTSNAQAAETNSESGQEEIRVGFSLENSTSLGYAGQPGLTTRSIPFDLGDTVQCDLLKNKDHDLYTWETFKYSAIGSNPGWGGYDVTLYCGTDKTSGFKHIKSGHQWAKPGYEIGWETIRASASKALGHDAPQWDEFMTHGINDSLMQSNPYPVYKKSNNTTCFSAPFYVFKGTSIYASFYVNTVVSRSNHSIVTAYPSDKFASAC